MSSPTLKDPPDELPRCRRERALSQRPSLNREAIMLPEQALTPRAHAVPESVADAQRDAQLDAWAGLDGRWPGGDAALDAMVEDIYETRSEGREVGL
jgi:hypothetical protein